MPTGSGTIMMAKDPSGKYKDCRMDAEGNLKCELTSAIDVAIGDVEMTGTANPDGSGAKRHLVLDANGAMSVNNITKGKDATAVGAELQQVLMYGKKPDGTLQPLETSGDRLLVDCLELAASGKITTSTALSSVQVCGFDEVTSKFKTMNVDSSGNVQVDIVSSAAGGDASAANQLTANTHLSEIEGAVEALEGCINANKVKVEFEAGDLNIGNVDVASSALPTGAATSALQTTLNDKFLVVAPTAGIADTTLQQRVNLGLHDSANNNVLTAKCDANGFLQVADTALTRLAPTIQQSETTILQRVNLSLHDTANNSTQTAKCDANGNLKVTMSGGSDATAANQLTAIGHLSEIEGAVEALEGCINANKVKVELEAGDLNVGNVDVVSAAGITQLPSTLGQKANASSLSTCRSSTAGAYDLSARTTIGTAATTTKLACSAAGHLNVKTAVNTSSGGGTNTATITSGSLGHVESLSADNTFCNINMMIDTTDSGSVSDLYVMVARANNSLADYFINNVVSSSGGPGSNAITWTELPGTTRYYASVHIDCPPEYVALYNPGPASNKVAVLFNYGLE